jgi:hypothetical protein
LHVLELDQVLGVLLLLGQTGEHVTKLLLHCLHNSTKVPYQLR